MAVAPTPIAVLAAAIEEASTGTPARIDGYGVAGIIAVTPTRLRWVPDVGAPVEGERQTVARHVVGLLCVGLARASGGPS